MKKTKPSRANSNGKRSKPARVPAGRIQTKASRKSATQVASSTTLTVRVLKGDSYNLLVGPQFKQTALYWEYVLRNRIRWLRDGRVPASVVERSERTLKEIGLDEAKLSAIAIAGAVEIEIPYITENEGWEFRIFPWEFLLDNATSKQRGDAALIVIRHIRREAKSASSSSPPKKLMVVESSPGPLGEIFSERRLVRSNLGLTEVPCPVDPTADQLQEAIAKHRPDVFHLAGVDSHQGMQLLGHGSDKLDGYMMATTDGTPVAISAEQLAPPLRGKGKHRPHLVACNFCNSAVRVAALIAAESAQTAIGFQDEVEDRAAENFFAKFYFAWQSLHWDLLEAFRVALRETRLGGAVVVLWNARSLLAGIQERSLQTAAKEVLAERKKTPSRDPMQMDPREVLEPVIKLKDTLNYSLLQNDEDLFDEFSIRKLCDGTIRGVGSGGMQPALPTRTWS